jgi:hypothetical protein
VMSPSAKTTVCGFTVRDTSAGLASAQGIHHHARGFARFVCVVRGCGYGGSLRSTPRTVLALLSQLREHFRANDDRMPAHHEQPIELWNCSGA